MEELLEGMLITLTVKKLISYHTHIYSTDWE